MKTIDADIGIVVSGPAGARAEAYAADGDFSSDPERPRRLFEQKLRVSRLARRILFERGVGAAPVRLGTTSDRAQGVSGAVANATNEDDSSICRLHGRTIRGHRRLRTDPDAALRGGRSPVPCGCPDNGTPAEIRCG